MVERTQGSVKEKTDMSSLAATQGIPFSADEIRRALESVATPGWNGSIGFEVLIAPEAAKYISIVVIRRQVDKIGGSHQSTRQVLPDPTRKKPVESVIEEIKDKLRLTTVLKALEIQVGDGVLQKKTVQE